jgi:hypothetical protein
MLKNIKDHGQTLEEKSKLAPLTPEEYVAWCEEDSKTWAEEYLDNPLPGELNDASDEDLFPALHLGDEDFF